MRMKKVFRPGGMLLALVALAWLPTYALGAKFLVMLDNSGSYKRQGEVYLADMIDIMAVAGDDEYYFAPIGANEKTIVPVGSSQDEIERNDELRRIFQFNDVNTLINASLARVEGTRAFEESTEILIVSDMDPDTQNFRGSQWCFNEADMRDAIAFVRRLDTWAAKGKKLTLVLHNWDATASAIYNTDELDQELQQRLQEIKSYTVCRSKKTISRNNFAAAQERKRNQLLVEKALNRLSTKYPKVVLRNIRPEKTDAFLGLLCGRLGVNDPQQEVCVRPTKLDFKVKIAIHPDLSPGDEGMDSVRKMLPNEVYAPQKRNITSVSIDTKNPKGAIANYDYVFTVRAGKGSAEPFQRPIIKTTAKNCENQEIVTKTSVSLRDGMHTDTQQMLAWVGTEIYTLLHDYIEEDCPVVKPLKHFRLVGYQGKDIPIGNYFFVQTTFGGGDGSQDEFSEVRSTKPLGAVSFRIPLASDAKHSLFLETSSEKQINLGDILNRAVQGRGLVKFKIDNKYHRKLSLSFAPPDSLPDMSITQATAFPLQVKTFLKGTQQNLIQEGRYETPQPIELRILPGEYEIELTPDQNEWKVAFVTMNTEDPSPSNMRVVDFELDPLQDKALWNENVAGWVKYGDLVGKAIDSLDDSAYFLEALLRYSSVKLETGKEEEIEKLTKLWELLQKQLIVRARTLEHRLGRAMKKIHLEDQALRVGSGNTDWHKWGYGIVREMFTHFLQQSSMLDGQSSSSLVMRSDYNAWIERATDRSGNNRLMSPKLAKYLRAKKRNAHANR